MRDNVVTQGQSCTINGCQNVTISHKGGGEIDASLVLASNTEPRVDIKKADTGYLQADYGVIRPNIDTQYTPKDKNGVKANFHIMCETSAGDWEYLLVEEGTLFLIDGQSVMVRRKRN